MAALEGEISRLIGNLEGLSSRISELTEIQKSLGGIEVAIRNLDTNSEQHRGDIQKIYKLVAELRTDATTAKTSIDSIEKSINKEIDLLKKALLAIAKKKVTADEPEFRKWIQEQETKEESTNQKKWDLKKIGIGSLLATIGSIFVGIVIWLTKHFLTKWFN